MAARTGRVHVSSALLKQKCNTKTLKSCHLKKAKLNFQTPFFRCKLLVSRKVEDILPKLRDFARWTSHDKNGPEVKLLASPLHLPSSQLRRAGHEFVEILVGCIDG